MVHQCHVSSLMQEPVLVNGSARQALLSPSMHVMDKQSIRETPGVLVNIHLIQ